MRKIVGSQRPLPVDKPRFLILAFCGFAVVLWILHDNDYRALLRTVAEAGGGLAIVVLIRGTIIATCGLAWRSLRSAAAVQVGVALGLRTVRKAMPLPSLSYGPFGGAFHCATLDTRRRGAVEDYF